MLTACVIASIACLASPGEAELAAKLPAIFEKSAAHYRAIDAAATPLMNSGNVKEAVPHGDKPYGERRVPHGWNAKKNALDMRSIYWWTSGHFPGSLWYLYEATGDEFFKERATVWTEFIAPNSKVSDNHDVGFIMYCSFGNARRLLKTDKYDDLLRETAASLSKRFNPELGLIRSWGPLNGKKDFLVIPDNMMNLELLEWAAKNGGEKRFDEIARSHATKTMSHHFRADGGTYHVLNYDQRPGFHGAVQEIRRGQGLSCETAWSRGQSWAIYGYTMMYRETKDPAYLAFAQKVSDFAIDNPNMPEDGVPYWDYGAPGEERDSSAASVMASGLLELSTFVGGEKGAKYRAFAVKQLLSLCSDAYFAKPGENGDWLLKHGVGHKPAYSEIDVPLDYGDYYFLEALLRFRALGRSLQDEIDATAAKGGGKVIVPAGEHFCAGPIRLRSNIELHLEEGAKLVFSDNPQDYLPAVPTSWEGVECLNYSPLVYAYGCTNVAITGKGTLAPKMDFWRKWFGRGEGHKAATRKLYDWCSFLAPVSERDLTKLPESNVRPHLVQFNRCKNVRLEGFKIRESPFWTIHLYLCDGVVARGLDVYAHGHNNDGIDIEMTKNVLVENCRFDQGDDAIVIKAGRNQDAWRLATPSENIEVRNCTVVNGHVLLGVGSEMSGGVRNVYMHDCVLESEALRLFYVKTNERRGGFVEDIRMENVKAKKVRWGVMSVETDVLYQWKDFPTHEVRVTPIKNLSMKNVEVEEAERLVHILGDARCPVDGVKLENVRLGKALKGNRIENATNVQVVP